MRTRLTELLSLDHPIVQAPMAGVSTPGLAAAVSNAGALGMVVLGALDAAGADAALRAAMAATDRPLGANVFVHDTPTRDAAVEREWCEALRPLFAELGAEPPERLTETYRSFNDADDVLDVVLAHRPRVVSVHFGVPTPERVGALKGRGVLLFGTATSVAEAARLEAAGIDVIVAQGREAGGHHGAFDAAAALQSLGTMALTRQIVNVVRVPVLAAGGIMDGSGIAAALALGAAGAQLGTAFITATESSADAAYRRRLLHGAPVATAVTAAISGRAARGLRTRLMASLDALTSRVPAYPVAYDAAKALVAAAARAGVPDVAVQWAGEGAGWNRALPAAALVEALATELHAELRRLGALVGG